MFRGSAGGLLGGLRRVLAGEEFEAGGEGGAVDGGEDRVPGFDEVVAAGVGEDAEGCVGGEGGEGGEDVADELVAVDHGALGFWLVICVW